jgi:CRISPR-associated protein Csm1
MEFLLKVDISGIQDFIFSIPSKGAARNLKGRSFFVHALTEIAEHFFLDAFNGNKKDDVLYNGGGNLFIFLQGDEGLLNEKINLFQKSFTGQAIFPYIGYVITKEKSFQDQMMELSQEMNRKKLKRPFPHYSPYLANDPQEFDSYEGFTQNMMKAKGYSIKQKKDTKLKIQDKYFDVSGYTLELEFVNPQIKFDNILNKLPVEKDSVIDFDHIARKAREERGVDDKLAVLKMDVDNLGSIFRDRIKNGNDYKKLSREIRCFFSETLYALLLKKPIDEGNLYPVFAGGDDCLLIGAWDVVLPIATKIHQAFGDFQNKLRTEVSNVSEITISAGIVVANPNYPMVRLAEEAENALELAKEKGKNRIAVFGEVLKWNEYGDSEELSGILKSLIEKGESRALLERIRSSEIGFRSLQERAVNQRRMDFPKVYRLKYFLRNVKNQENRDILDKEFSRYSDALVSDFVNGYKESNAAKFPVAARWAELLTKTIN